MGKIKQSPDTKLSPRKARCGSCKGCKQVNCGECKHCLDKPAFGGANTLKKACLHRNCTNVQEIMMKKPESPASKSVETTPTSTPKKYSTKDLTSPTETRTAKKDVQGPKESPKKEVSGKAATLIRMVSRTRSPATGSSVKTEPVSASKSQTNEGKTEQSPVKRQISSDGRFCEMCQQHFKSQSRLDNHMWVHQYISEQKAGKTEEVFCKVCQKSFKSIRSFYSHMHVHSTERDVDKSVSKDTESESEEDSDEESPVEAVDSETVSCSVCSKEFLTQCSLNGHMRVHSSRKASIGDTKSDLKGESEKAIPDDSETISCSICHKEFETMRSLNGHMQVHATRTADRSPMKATSESARMSDSHEDTNDAADGPVSCPCCQKEFKTKGSLNGHMWVHKDRTLVENQEPVIIDSGKDLKKISLDTMTKGDLKKFIPEMLQTVTGRDEIWHSRRSARPDWWPTDVSWMTSKHEWKRQHWYMDSLRDIVINCYKYYGKQDLLSLINVSPKIQEAKLYNTDQLSHMYPNGAESPMIGSYPPSPIKSRIFPKGLFFPFSAEIYICYFCEKEFLNKEKMRSHQKECAERPPELFKYPTAPTLVPNDNPAGPTGPPCPPPISPKRQVYPSETMDKYSAYLDLVPKQTAANMRASRKNSEIDCTIIDEPQTPVTPVTPRTPKSLMSQLSRDCSKDDAAQVSKKRLSYSLSVDKGKESKSDVLLEEAETSGEEGEPEPATNKEKELNLLSIPISSPLGQRIQKYVHVELPTPVVDDSESFCRTPVKNSFLEKLRKKPPTYPIIYRPRRLANLHKENHTYKFTKAEVKEFICKMTTGMNTESLEKVKLLKPRARVVVARMSRNTLVRWEPRKVLLRMMRNYFKNYQFDTESNSKLEVCEFPSGPTLLAKNIDKLLGLKKRSSLETPKTPLTPADLSLGNFVSEEMEAEVSKQKLTLYRSLLYEMSVLKPTVVVEDLNQDGHKHTINHSANIQSVNNVNNPSFMNIGRKTIIPVIKPDVRERSVLRTMLYQSKEDRYVLEASHRKLINTSHEDNNFSEDDRKRMRQRRAERLSLEVAERERKAAKTRNDVESPIVITNVTVSKDNDNPNGSKISDINSPVPNVGISIESLPCTPTQVRNVEVSPNASVKVKSPTDDTLSVVSLSSEGESLHSNCCAACSSKKMTFLTSPTKCLCDSVSSSTIKTVSTENLMKATDLFEPLTVSVGTEIESADKHLMYGIPSPVSGCSESPLPFTPIKSTVGDDFSPLKEMSTPVSLTSSIQESSPSRQTNRPLLEMTLRTPSLPSTLSVTSIGDVLTPAASVERVSSIDRVNILRDTRSRSLTPASSPSKMSTRFSTSLPNTPEKSGNKKDRLIKTMSVPVPAGVAKVKMMLRNSTDKNVIMPIRTRSLSGTSDVSQTRNAYSLKSGNFIVSSPPKTPPHATQFMSFKSDSLKSSRSDSKLSAAKVDSKPASPVRRSKRMASTPLDCPEPSKLRKVQSDVTLQSR